MAETQERPGAGDYIWLAYSIFFFIEPIVRNNRTYWLKNIAIYLVFLVTYIACVRTLWHTRKLALLLAMAVIGLAAFPLNAGSTCFLTFSVAILPFSIESTVAVVLAITLASVAVVLEGRLLHLSWPDYTLSVFMMIVVGTSNVFLSQKKRATSRLLRAQDEIERLAAISERERIARDLHDVLGHTLSVIVLKSELAGRLLARDPDHHLAAALREITDVERTARTALAEVREAIGGYRARGLPAEIAHARQTLATAGVTLTADLPKHLDLSATQETVLSLAIREAVTNIVRHARASTAAIHLATTPAGEHTLRIADNGTTSRPHSEGNGLRGMRERVQSLGGRFSITLAQPGTALQIHLPSATPLLLPDTDETRLESIPAAQPEPLPQ